MCLGISLLRDLFLAHKKSFINEHPLTTSSKSPGSLHFVGLRTPCVLLYRRVKRRQGVPLDFVSKQCYSVSHLVQLLRIGHVATPPCEGCWSTWMNWWIDVPGDKFTSCNRKEQGFCGELVIYRAACTLSMWHIFLVHLPYKWSALCCTLFGRLTCPGEIPAATSEILSTQSRQVHWESSEVLPSQCRGSLSSERWGKGVARVELIKQMFSWWITAQLSWACRKWRHRKVAILR